MDILLRQREYNYLNFVVIFSSNSSIICSLSNSKIGGKTDTHTTPQKNSIIAEKRGIMMDDNEKKVFHPTKLSRYGESFDFCLEIKVASDNKESYCLYGEADDLRHHYGAIFCTSSELWLGALDSFNLPKSSDICGERAVFLYADLSGGNDNLRVVIFFEGEFLGWLIHCCNSNIQRTATDCRSQ